MFYLVTGERGDLSDRIMRWMGRYFRLRADRSFVNPQVGNAFGLFDAR